MTRQEAIKIIDCYDIGFYDLSGAKIPADKLADAFDMAIEALEQEPTAEYSSDVISRQAAVDAFDGVKVDEKTEYDIGYNDGIDLAVSKLSVLPSAQPFTEDQIQTMQELESAQIEKAYELGKADRPTGYWLDYRNEGFVECPFCHSATTCEGNSDELKYCFSCGARLESDTE